MVRHTLKMSGHFGTLSIKGLKSKHFSKYIKHRTKFIVSYQRGVRANQLV